MLSKLKILGSAFIALVLITLICEPFIYLILHNLDVEAFGYIIIFALIDNIVRNISFHFKNK